MIELLLASYEVLREGILCEVFLQRCSAAWEGAQGQRLTISIMLPGRRTLESTGMCCTTGCTAFAPTGISFRQLEELLFNRATRSSRRNPYEEKAYRGPRYNEVQAKWEQSKRWMAYYEHYCVPMVVDVSGIVLEFRSKDIRMLCH